MKYCEIRNKIIGSGRPKICVPLVGTTDEEMLWQADKVLEEAGNEGIIDMVEFRGDFYEGLNDMKQLSAILGMLRDKLGDIILLFTVRSEKEGGEPLKFDTPSVREINSFVIKNKLADMVDLELFSDSAELVGLAKENDVKVIMSNHDFETTPDTDIIVNRLGRMQALGADIAKIAVMPENKMHVIKLLEATVMSNECTHIPIVAISMGKAGAISRMSGELFGSAISFAVIGKASAPGQIPVGELAGMIEMIEGYCV